MNAFANARSGRPWRRGARLRHGALEAAWLTDAEPRTEGVAAGAVLLAELTGDAAQGEVVAGAHGGEAFDAVTLVLAGTLHVGEGAHGLVFAAGGVMLWNSGQSGHFSASNGLRVLHLLIPRALARQRWPALVVGTEARAHCGARWALTLALAGAAALWAERSELTTDELEAATAAVLDLLARHGGPAPVRHPPRLEQVMALVDGHLDDPGLSPAWLAARLGTSVRTLHALLARHQLTVGGVIRARRLECCRAALAEATPEASVADIGSRFGLTDAAHFSRLFKRAYGAGPREYRRRLQQGPARRS